jgi:hypothetical protein
MCHPGKRTIPENASRLAISQPIQEPNYKCFRKFSLCQYLEKLKKEIRFQILNNILKCSFIINSFILLTQLAL